MRPWAIVAYGLFALWWVRVQGLITDRITALIAVAGFMVCASLGKPLRLWWQAARDLAVYAAMWLLYDTTRGAADGLGMPVQATLGRTLDRIVFLGADPTVWLQPRFYDPAQVRWYDQVASLVYYSHFVVPVVAVAVLWATDRAQWIRLMRRMATVLVLACITFVVLPTEPPWMASAQGVVAPLQRHTARGLLSLGFRGFVHHWQSALDWTNQVAAIPSLHAAFALLVPMFFLTRVQRRWVRVLMLTYPVAMLTALVYFAEHWVSDGLIAFAMVGATCAVWHRVETRGLLQPRIAATVDMELQAGDELGLVAAQEGDDGAEVGRVADDAGRDT